MEFSWFHFDPPFLIKTNKIWTLDTKFQQSKTRDVSRLILCTILV